MAQRYGKLPSEILERPARLYRIDAEVLSVAGDINQQVARYEQTPGVDHATAWRQVVGRIETDAKAQARYKGKRRDG